MKQGRADKSGHGGYKVEPKSQAVHPGGVSQIGVAIDPRNHQPMYEGRGYHAPKAGHQVHHRGSQGRH